MCCNLSFYSGVSRALRFASSIEFTPISEYMASPAFLDHPLYLVYTKARQDLIAWGVKEPEEAQSSLEGTPSLTSNRCQSTSPTVAEVLVHDSSKWLVFPDQKVLTRLAQKAHQCWSVQGLSDEGKRRTQHLSRQTITARSEADETLKYLQGIAKFPEKLQLWHLPLAFI